MKILILLLLFIPTVLFSQLYPVNETTINLSHIIGVNKEEKVPAFAISNLITVKEFKIYLEDVRKDSTEAFYKNQLPKSTTITKEVVEIILSDSALQNKPMPGVSWSVARNYCHWLNQKSSSTKLGFEYDLPLLTELIAFNNLYHTLENSELESWTLNSYNENLIEGILNSVNFQYNAIATDPPAMKRKIIYGGSYHMSYNNNNTHGLFPHEYQDSSSRYVGFRIVKRFKNLTSESLSIGNISLKYGLKNNHLHGIYQENYTNGKPKVRGMFLNNNRYGIWSVWDENGNLKIQRDYKNNKTCNFIYPITNNPYKQIYNSFPEYSLERNDNDYYPYLYVEERAVAYSQRIWRQLTALNEPNLFKQIDFKKLVAEIFENDKQWFLYGNNGDFKNKISKDTIFALKAQSESWDYHRIEVKEDFYFNMENLLSDTRQLGLSFYKDPSDQSPSYLIYFPNIRDILTNYEFDASTFTDVKHLDDLFFFHNYRGKIISNRNFYFSNTTETNESSDEFRMELEKYIHEHDLWLSYGR
ncbi:MAG TPA: SUMF1/EgtB/PvdO family nonheme iron enzyme [Brumimicrobium sp.]|nr:SUMF1/EgtB/PvdO family nonheme iron enzyme [Brumimicrobium sp.]